MVYVVERAIEARKRYAARFQKNGGVDNCHSTEAHLHFVGILEEALRILNLISKDEPVKDTVEQEVKSKESSALYNRFSELEIENMEDIIDESMIQETIITSKKPTKSRLW
ncbi:hypothetical protein G7Y89_g9405 [Cudoniella acicularis]|uniref:DUF6604 domain-containing protein n=1 Tax=Cudoniella acicularis TaxID=354080 RepID=A0A8H4RGX6_9HELO|nr:hypothetical protein G7Y89_g9405 [Cudoniella acicularis]